MAVEETIEIDLGLVVPVLESGDACIQMLTERLSAQRGIQRAHVVREGKDAHLCLHFDPNQVSLAEVERIAQDSGAQFTDRYCHEQIPFTGLNTADSAVSLEKLLSKQAGVLHVSVNYAAGLIFIAYDTQVIQRAAIEAVLHSAQARTVAASPAEAHEHDGAACSHHGSAPTFLPHWLQERWTLFLIVLTALFFLIGFVGETFLDMNEGLAIAFFVLAYITGGYEIATHAIPGLFRGEFDTDVLMLAAAAGAAILGEWTEGAFLLLLFGIGHAGEHYALDRARNAVNALGSLMPATARVRRGDAIVELTVEALQLEDIVVVRPGDRIPVDGAISSGTTTIDQSAITGESVPVSRTLQDDVFAGTINQDNAIEVRVTRLAADNTLSRVMQLVAEAQSQQSPTQQFTQRFTAWFVPAILIGTFLFVIIPPLLNLSSLQDSFYRGMLLLVAASPCALAIGTPAAVLSGIAQAARHGVLIKGGVHLENLGNLKAIAFDKTGTITKGEFSITRIVPLNGNSEEEVLRIAAAVEQQASHPLAQAIVRAAGERSLSLPEASGLENVAGKGVRSQVNGQKVLLGALRLYEEADAPHASDELVQAVKKLEGEGKTTVIVNQGGVFMGIIALADVPRATARDVIQQLKATGIEHLIMLTGDNASVAQDIARQVGLTDVRAELLPEDKLKAIQALERQYGAIAMIGDGVNDAPALATATVGMAMGGVGTAVALETADVALMADDLSKLPFAVGLSRASKRIIRQNLAISLGVIGLLILSSVFGVVQLSGAVVLHEGSTILVVLNALRLLVYKPDPSLPTQAQRGVSAPAA